MRRAFVAVVMLLCVVCVVGCDVGEPDAPPPNPATRAVDPAPTDPSQYLEYGDTDQQPDLLPGGGAAPALAVPLPLRVAADGCAVRRLGDRLLPDGLAWMVNSRAGTGQDARGERRSFRPQVRGSAVVSLVVREETADGVVLRQVSNTVRVRCR